jgi:hypothetical protein
LKTCARLELEISGISIHKNHGIPRNFVEFRDTDFRIIPQNFENFHEYTEVKKTYEILCVRNSVNTLPITREARSLILNSLSKTR